MTNSWEKKDIINDENLNNNKDNSKKNEDILNFDQNIQSNDNFGIDDIIQVIWEREEIWEKEEVWKTEYEKQINYWNKKEKKVIDTNINTLDFIIEILADNKYDYVILKPNENYVEVIFKKNKSIKDTKYIKYPTYSNILINAKIITKLTVDETKEQQDWEWEINIWKLTYLIKTKVVPYWYWSKLYIKAIEKERKLNQIKKKKLSPWRMFTFLLILFFILVIVWAMFLVFIVMSAQTVEDVRFFSSLWINLNDINRFIYQSVTLVFSILIFFEVLLLIISLFKTAITKREFKRKRIKFFILSVFIMTITLMNASFWMYIERKIQELPNWQEMAYWNIQLYDNSKLLSNEFNKSNSLLTDTTSLIWPLQVKFDLTYFSKNEQRKGLEIIKYTWDFWNGETIETTIPTIIYDFDKINNYKIKLILEEVDSIWKTFEKVIDDIPNINITHVVDIEEKKLNTWWKIVNFDASSLKELGSIEWYYMDDLENPVKKDEKFFIWDPIFKETLIWMYIRRNDKTSNLLDKLFVISWNNETKLDWEITYKRSIVDDLEYEIQLENQVNDYWDWFIEEYEWIIWTKSIIKSWNIQKPVEASKIIYKFDSYWKHEVKVKIKNSVWEQIEITKIIDVSIKLSLLKPLVIMDNWSIIEDYKYEEKVYEYYLNKIPVPTELTFDARLLRTNNILYSLKEVTFDYDSDWNIDEVTKLWKYKINFEWNNTVTVNYKFQNRKDSEDLINITEKIYIEWIKKEAILDFDINKTTTYTPVIVSFDASKSQVKDENIEKFIWDYWDWIVEERDAIVPGHRYTEPWDYIIKLEVITSSWKKYSISKSLILKPKPMILKITTSMLKARVWQWINFYSEESEWNIVSYFWNFWDWEVSNEANPIHSYKKPWKYIVTLKAYFINKNVLEDKIEIEILDNR